jgi:tRNA threonylcarbamoyladenosine biosynthesis protein TsaB
MAESQSVAERGAGEGMLVLGVDTCGTAGSVALARIVGGGVEVLGQTELAGKTYSATLVAAVERVLAVQTVKLAEVGAIVVVSGPGSFTGVRVGLSAVKGLAEPGQIPVVAVSRLAVLAAKAGVVSAALDAHRHEVFLRVEGDGGVRELLAGAEELSQVSSRYAPVPGGSQVSEARPGAPYVVAVCDEAAAGMLAQMWGGIELVRVEAPTAADAISLCLPEILGGRFADLALLDGHYLRRSDAEIFGESAKAVSGRASGISVRRMAAQDIDAVMEIAAKTDHAPRWARQAYVATLDAGNQPRRIALVAEGESGGLAGLVVAAILPASVGTGCEAELESIVTASPHQRRGVARELFAVLKTELRRQGTREVILEVRAANHSAQAFYRFLGFREEGRRAGYYVDPVEDAVLMRVGLT